METSIVIVKVAKQEQSSWMVLISVSQLEYLHEKNVSEFIFFFIFPSVKHHIFCAAIKIIMTK